MRVSLLVTTAVFAATASPVMAAHQWIVIGTNGRIMDVDPQPFLPESRHLRKLRAEEKQAENIRRNDFVDHPHTATSDRTSATEDALPTRRDTIDDGFYDEDDEEPIAIQANHTESLFDSEPAIPDIETLILATDTTHYDDWADAFDADDEMSGATVRVLDDPKIGIDSAPPPTFLSNVLVALDDDASYPAVQGSVVFAELSCLFVAFIAYLVYSVPLWSSLSIGQKWCLLVASMAALFYQFVAVGWYYSAVSPDVTLSISSLITRTLSLGMVPVTSTSFIYRARASAEVAATQDKPPNHVVRSKPSRHRKARSS